MGTKCAPLVANSFLFYHERDFIMSLSVDKHADIIDINNVYFDNMVIQIYLSELQLKVYTSETKAAFLDLHLAISYDIFSTKLYDERDAFDF